MIHDFTAVPSVEDELFGTCSAAFATSHSPQDFPYCTSLKHTAKIETDIIHVQKQLGTAEQFLAHLTSVDHFK